ncbi:MAG: DUF1311 domain-containing protein [Betaproteobacteria bacterium]|nr:DUF1311 domain-containing protein [Betaproteobacteria bacterium]
MRNLIWVLALVANPAWGVLDCARAKTGVEKLICFNTRVAAADREMARAFRRAFAMSTDRQALLQSQQSWVTQVRDQCLDADCLVSVFAERTADLEDLR